MPDPVLQIDAAVKRFGAVTAVDGVSLEVAGDEFFALLGPSGSGKTTLLRIIAGLETPDRGRVLIGGQDVTRLAPYSRGIGMVFQDFLLFPHKTVAENIVFPLKMKRLSADEQRRQLAWVAGLVRLEGFEERYPHQLSGGQKQRVSLARGLVARPSLLLLDEPLANLDRELRKEMEVEVRRFQVELGIPFIYVTHNQEEALTMSDRIAVMDRGRIEQEGRKLEVYANPATRFVAGFVGSSNLLAGRLSEVSGPMARLDWDGLQVVVPRPDGAEAGDPVELYVKSERIAIAPASADETAGVPNRLEGRLRDIIFKGQYADYLVALDNGAELVVSDAPEIAGVARRGAVTVTWPPAAGHAFLAEAGSTQSHEAVSQRAEPKGKA
jgi:putative spermidine/putrescine transport system ATP-binding protein/spermidine/putrescine transport system ATP-binding protein